MHECDECGKSMATAGGLEIHKEMAHGAGAHPAADEPTTADVAVPDLPIDVLAGAPLERPSRRRQTSAPSSLSAIPAIALAIVALLVAGVATAYVRGNTSESPLAAVQAAATRTTDANTAQVSATVKADSGPLANGVTIDGGFDFSNHRGRLEIDPSRFGAPGIGKIQAIFDYSSGIIVYMKFPAAAAQELDGKQWVKMDVSALMRQAGLDVDLGSLVQGQSNDPTSGLQVLRGADNVVKVGTEQVRGTDTTHYRADASLDKAIAQAPTPAARDGITKIASLYTVRTFPMDVWIDSDGRARRFQFSVDTSTLHLPGGVPTPAMGRLGLTYELYDFGSAVDTQVPPPDQVIDFVDLLRRAG